MGPAMGRALNDADIVPRTVRSWMRWRRCGDVRWSPASSRACDRLWSAPGLEITLFIHWPRWPA